MDLLTIADLRIAYPTIHGGLLHVVNGVDLKLRAGEVCALVGESGSGKSQTAMAAMGLLGEKAQISGAIHFRGRELLASDENTLRGIRGSQIAMVFQDPMTALNPYLTIERQLVPPLLIDNPMYITFMFQQTDTH